MITIGPLSVGHGYPCRFVAELSNNHNGSLATALRLIRAAKAAGADAVKIQCYTADELVALRGDGSAPEPWGAQGWSMRTLYDHAATPIAWMPDLFQAAQTAGIPLFASVFGLASLAVMERCGCPAYKIARLDNHAASLLAAVRATGKPVIVSVAATDLVRGDITLFCPPGYPQPPEAFTDVYTDDPQPTANLTHSALHSPSGLPQVRAFASAYQGISYHGTNPYVGLFAARSGAQMVEAHFQLTDTPSALESQVSLTDKQFRTMVEGSR